MVAMSAFYIECKNKGIVSINSTAVRWNNFMGTKYLVIGGIENEAPQWILKGTQGTLIEDSA